MGFWELLTGRDRYRISGSSAGSEPIAADARTAIVMPICNEDVPRVFAGLRATYESVAATGELERFDFFVLSDTNHPGYRRGGTKGLDGAVPGSPGLRPDLLPPPPASGEAQERQHRRLLPSLGRPVQLHGGAGRRQRDERRLPDRAGAPDGGQPGRRHHPVRAEGVRHGHPVCAHAAVRHPRLRAAVYRRPALLAAGRVALLGPQRDHPREALHRALRPGAAAGQGLLRRRDPVPRLRRSGADAPCRLGRVDRLRPAGQRTKSCRRTCWTSSSATAAGATAT